MNPSFESMGLCSPLLSALQALNITTPTPVQSEVYTKAVEGRDLLVSSQTGSGKTFAFLLPVMNKMMAQAISPMDNLSGPEVLVLCPTRELAQQVSQDAINLVKSFKGLRVAVVVGGMPYGKQMAGLKGARLVVGTPGRLLDLANQGKLNLSSVQHLIVDEADRMLDLGFAEDLKSLGKLCGKREQTLMFSATFAKHVQGLAGAMTEDALRIELAPANQTNTDIRQTLHWTDGGAHRQRLLSHWLNQPELEQAVIFTRTQSDAEDLARDLEGRGYPTCALHGAMPQVVRNRRLNSVRNGNVRVLVATDVAARGLDVPAISHVINYGVPMKAEDYVHRIGRTGRAGRSGVAVTLAFADEIGKVREIERFINAQIPVEAIAGLEPRVTPQDRPSKGGKPGGKRRQGDGPKREGFGRDRSFGRKEESSSREGFAKRREFGDRGNAEGRSEFKSRSEFRRDGEARTNSEGFKPRGEFRRDGEARTNSEGFKPRGEFRRDGEFKPRGEFRKRDDVGRSGDTRRSEGFPQGGFKQEARSEWSPRSDKGRDQERSPTFGPRGRGTDGDQRSTSRFEGRRDFSEGRNRGSRPESTPARGGFTRRQSS